MFVGQIFVAVVLAAGCGDDAGGEVVEPPGDTGAATSGAAATGATVADSTTTGDDGAATPQDASSPDDGPADAAEAWQDTDLRLEPVASVDQPMVLAARPDSGDLWVAERVGRVRRISRSVDGDDESLTLLSEPVLDITDRVGTEGEGGLLGMAFSADGTRLYLHYTDTRIDTVVAEYEMQGDAASPASERILLRVDQPYSNHNGGDLHFGPDGYLYTGLGDGGSGGDPLGSGQDPTTLLGSMLRIDPEAGPSAPYGVPSDNPFVGDDAGRDEVWMYGLRNPWRFSFDRMTGDLWIADVGQGEVEEINFVAAGEGAGANFGWNLREGDDQFSGAAPEGHLGPIHTYGHDDGRCSVTGGFVYRGSLLPNFDGVYVYADYCDNVLTGVEHNGVGEPMVTDLMLDRDVAEVAGFGEGPDGEIYVLERSSGRISRLQPPDLALVTTLSSG